MPVNSLCLRMYQIIDLATSKISAICLLGLSRFPQPHDSLLQLYQHLSELHSERSHERLFSPNSNPWNQLQTFYLQATPGHECDYQFSNYLETLKMEGLCIKWLEFLSS